MPMQRTGTMSTKHELLQQIRDAVNPAQTLQNRVAILQAGLSVAGILVLVVFVSLIYGTLENTKHTTEKLDESMATTLALMQDMSSSLNTTQSFLGYLGVLPEMVLGMENMATNIGISTDTMGCSAIFGGNSKPECQA